MPDDFHIQFHIFREPLGNVLNSLETNKNSQIHCTTTYTEVFCWTSKLCSAPYVCNQRYWCYFQVNIMCDVLFLLKQSWFTVLCKFLLYGKVIQLYIYVYFIILIFLLWLIIGYLIWFSVLYSRTSLFICPIYTSLHLLLPDFQSTPSPLEATSLFSMSMSLFHRQVCLWKDSPLLFALT